MWHGRPSLKPIFHTSALALWLTFCVAGCSSSDEGASVAGIAQQQGLREEVAAFTGRTAEELLSDASALQLGERLFGAYCASCHGTDATGKQRVTNLVDGVFNFGNGIDAIRTTITQGRKSIMPGVGNQYGEMNLGQLVAFVESLASDEPLGRLAEQGKLLYEESCAACHGMDGRGNVDLGGPNLADDYWLHGDTMMAIRLIITRGATGECPPHAQSLMIEEIELLTAFVTQLNTRARVN